jgi:predicted secreted hydrolase
VASRGGGLGPGGCRALACSVLAGVGLGAGCGESAIEAPRTPGLSLVETLGGVDTVGYTRAVEVRDFRFPDDHGPHEDFRTEWWYVTGNLTADDGRDFGFQFTVFRNALAPTASGAATAASPSGTSPSGISGSGTSASPASPSRWATNQAYMGHFALTDIESDAFRAAELFSRGTAFVAGARANPFAVWIEDWRLSAEDPGGVAAFPMRLVAGADDASLDLTLEAGKPVVLQGDHGLSRKGPDDGNASYYYSHTRMPARGKLVLGPDTVRVTGLAWLDREWSTSALDEGLVGWDWFAFQLDDGWDMIVYRLRREDGSAAAASEGALIDSAGNRTPLAWGRDVIVEHTGTWTSPLDGTVYPAGWRVRLPARGWDLNVRPAISDQELRLAFRYWEGAVTIEGTGDGGRLVSGRGYVELTGYAPPGS